MASLKDIYWLAGLLEGEGSFIFREPPNRLSGYPLISIQSSDYDTIYKVYSIMRTPGITTLSPKRINGNSGKLTMYSTRCSRMKETIGWMMTLYPLMSIRRKNRIGEIIRKWKLSVDGRLVERDNWYKKKKRLKEAHTAWIRMVNVESKGSIVNPFEKRQVL